MQLLLRAVGPATHAVDVAHGGTVLQLKQAIQAKTHIPSGEQVLTYCGRPLLDDTAHLHSICSLDGTPLSAGATVCCALRLAGGKGGFGALLRGQGRDGKITDNFDSCRDLSGRRVGQIEAEKKLKDWEAKAQQRQLEKMREKEARKEERLAVKEALQQVDVDKVKQEQRSAVGKVQEAVQSALAEGLSQGSRASASTSKEGSGDAGVSNGTTANNGKRKSPGQGAETGAAPVGRPPKRPSMLAALEGSGDDDDDDDDSSDGAE